MSGFPFLSLQDYLTALDAKGDVLDIDEVDQDKYELTALLHRMWREKGLEAPAVRVHRMKQDGRWYDQAPVVSNVVGRFENLCLAYGIEMPGDRSFSTLYPLAYDHLLGLMDAKFNWPLVPKGEVPQSEAPCQEVVLTGEEADLGDVPVIRHYPADSGRFFTTGMVILGDPELGLNVGTHRMEVKGPRKTGVYFTAGSHNLQFCRRAEQRGEKEIPVAVAVGTDPLAWIASSTRICDFGVDEFDMLGGVFGRPYPMVKAVTSDLLVPAHAEYIIEGVIPLDRIEKEGPFVEYTDYLGHSPPEGIHFIEVTAITRKKKPVYYSTWMGHTPRESNVYAGFPFTISTHIAAARNNPNIVRIYRPFETNWHMMVISVDKKHPGDGLQAGLSLLGNVGQGTMVKICIVVDKDVNPANWSEVIHQMGAHWQPVPGSLIMPQMRGYHLEHSTRVKGLTSKIIIDATRQMEDEGGPTVFEPRGVEIMRDQAPEAAELVDAKWESYWKGFSKK